MSLAARLIAAISASDDESFSKVLSEVTDASALNVEDDWTPPEGRDTGDKISPLSLACHLNKPNYVQALLQKGADANFLSNGQYAKYPIHYATLNKIGETCCIEILYKYGADIDAQNSFFGRTALFYACYHNLVDIVDFLLQRGADMEIEDCANSTALTISIMEENQHLICKLVEAGCDVNYQEGKPITLLIGMGPEFLDCIKLMVHYGADIERYKQTYFTAAVASNNIEMMHILKPYGIDINYGTDSDYFSPLHLACDPEENATSETVTLLLDWGADVNSNKWRDNLTPLELVYADLKKLLALLDYNPDMNKFYRGGTTPLYEQIIRFEHVVHEDLVKAVKLFLALGGQVTKEEFSRICHFEESDIVDIVQLLKAYTKEPRKLKDICRQQLRFCMSSKISEKVKLLPLPPFLKSFLMFSDIL